MWVDDDGVTADGARRVRHGDDPRAAAQRSCSRSVSVEREYKERVWARFFDNAALLYEIQKDVVRTHPDLQFYLETECDWKNLVQGQQLKDAK